MNGPRHKNKDNKKAGKDMVLLYLYHLFSNYKKGVARAKRKQMIVYGRKMFCLYKLKLSAKCAEVHLFSFTFFLKNRSLFWQNFYSNLFQLYRNALFHTALEPTFKGFKAKIEW